MPLQLFKSYFLTAAAHNARIAGKIEEAYRGQNTDDSYKGVKFERWQPIHDGHVMTSLISSFTSLEAAANEFLEDEMRWSTQEFHTIDRLREEYPKFFDYQSVLDKYQQILILLGEDVMDRGSEPFQSVKILGDVRNEFIHYKPQWLTVEDNDRENEPNIGKSSHRVGDALRTKNRDTNPFRETDSFFPGKCLSYDYARWGLESSRNFLEGFYSRFDIENPLIEWEIVEAEMEIDWESRESHPYYG